MKKLILITMCSVCVCSASTEKRALNSLQKAILRVPEIRSMINSTSNTLVQELNLDSPYVKYMVMIGAPLIRQEINTRDINLQYQTQKLTIKPDIRYDFNTGEISTEANLNYQF